MAFFECNVYNKKKTKNAKPVDNTGYFCTKIANVLC